MKFAMVLADDFQATEALAFLDCVRMAGLEAETFGLGAYEARSGTGILVRCDRRFSVRGDIDPAAYEGIVVPGGYGVDRIRANAEAIAAIKAFAVAGRWIYAICGGPLALAEAGVLAGRRFTCYPGIPADGTKEGTRLSDRTVVDGRLVTANSVGSSIEGALAFIRAVKGEAAAGEFAGWTHIVA